MGICWLASYPRSGNTWLRFLVCNYFHGHVTDSRQVDQHVPGIHGLMARRKGQPPDPAPDDGPQFYKTHWMYTGQMPLLDRTTAVVHLIRNPVDCLVSNIRYIQMAGISQADTASLMNDTLANLGPSVWKKLRFGSLMENHLSWQTALARHRGVQVRYEDMQANPAEVLSRVVGLLETPDPDRIQRAVERSSLANMRALEDRERQAGQQTVLYKPNWDGHRFVSGQRQRDSGSISIERVDQLARKLQPFAEYLGYGNAACTTDGIYHGATRPT